MTITTHVGRERSDSGNSVHQNVAKLSEKMSENSEKSDIDILEVRDSLRHACDASNEVAMGDHDTLGDACGAAGVHDNCDV